MQFESFTTFNLAILVLALGSWLNSKIKVLRDFNIPEPVTSIVQPDVGVTHDTKTQEIGYYGMLGTLFWLNMSLALGGLLQTGLHYIGANLPLFVCSLFAQLF